MVPRLVTCLLALAALLALPACTAVTEQASHSWARAAAEDSPADALSGVLRLQAAESESAASGEFEFVAAPFSFTGFSAGCRDGGPVRLLVAGLSDGIVATSTGVDLVCDGELHEFGVPGEGGVAVDTVGFSGTAAAPVSVVVRLPPRARAEAPEPADEWAGYFDERGAQLGAMASASWGSFGDDGLSSSSTMDAAIPPGIHRVLVECAGAPFVTVTVTPGAEDVRASEDAVIEDVACPGGATLQIATTIPGLTVTVDSHGERGAFLFAVDPEG